MPRRNCFIEVKTTMRVILSLFYAFAFTLNVTTLFYDFFFITWEGRPITDKLLKLTVYNFSLCTIYWALRFAGSLKRQRKEQNGYGSQGKLETFLRAVVLPQSSIVFLMFWAIYIYNADLLRSKELRSYMDKAGHVEILL